MYAPFAYLYVYIYDKYQPKGISLIFYLIFWSVFSMGFEAVAVYFHIFKYKHWKLTYSLTVFFGIQYITLGFYHYLQKVYHQKITNY